MKQLNMAKSFQSKHLSLMENKYKTVVGFLKFFSGLISKNKNPLKINFLSIAYSLLFISPRMKTFYLL